jgi:serine O-acetyltransferase
MIVNDLSKDLFRYTGKPFGLTVFMAAFFWQPGFRFLTLFRLCGQLSKFNPLGVLARLYFHRLKVKFGFQIPFTCNIGPGLFIGHFGGIVVNQAVVIGSNCNLAQGVTLGHVSRGSKKGSPIIGDRVWIGANAVVVGNIKIGNDVLIAPLTYINEDIPDHAVVMGNPSKVISLKGSQDYIKNIA